MAVPPSSLSNVAQVDRSLSVTVVTNATTTEADPAGVEGGLDPLFLGSAALPVDMTTDDDSVASTEAVMNRHDARLRDAVDSFASPRTVITGFTGISSAARRATLLQLPGAPVVPDANATDQDMLAFFRALSVFDEQQAVVEEEHFRLHGVPSRRSLLESRFGEAEGERQTLLGMMHGGEDPVMLPDGSYAHAPVPELSEERLADEERTSRVNAHFSHFLGLVLSGPFTDCTFDNAPFFNRLLIEGGGVDQALQEIDDLLDEIQIMQEACRGAVQLIRGRVVIRASVARAAFAPPDEEETMEDIEEDDEDEENDENDFTFN